MEVRRLGRTAVACVADVQDPDQITDSTARCASTLGSVDILVNNAGMVSRGSVEAMSDAEWSQVLDVNLSSAFHYARLTSSAMCERGWGRIINIASISGQTGGVSGSVAYSSSKGGLLAFTKTLARDLGPYAVTVNAVSPGQIQTAMGVEVPAEELAINTLRATFLAAGNQVEPRDEWERRLLSVAAHSPAIIPSRSSRRSAGKRDPALT